MTSAVAAARQGADRAWRGARPLTRVGARSRATAVCSVIVAIDDWRWASPPSGARPAGDLHRLGADTRGRARAPRRQPQPRVAAAARRRTSPARPPRRRGRPRSDAAGRHGGRPRRGGRAIAPEHTQEQQLAEERIAGVRAQGGLVSERARRPTRRSPRRAAVENAGWNVVLARDESSLGADTGDASVASWRCWACSGRSPSLVAWWNAPRRDRLHRVRGRSRRRDGHAQEVHRRARRGRIAGCGCGRGPRAPPKCPRRRVGGDRPATNPPGGMSTASR